MAMRRGLDRLAARVSQAFSSVWAALAAVLLAAAWIVAAFGGGLAGTWHFPEAWESVLVVVTHLVTFVMLFLIQSAQERHTRAIQLKLDELLRAVEGARDNRLVGVEEKGSEELDRTGEQLTNEPHPAAEDRPG
jgi:low affinity Fe/Cu permease